MKDSPLVILASPKGVKLELEENNMTEFKRTEGGGGEEEEEEEEEEGGK